MVLILILLAIAPDIFRVVRSGEAGVIYHTLGDGTATEQDAVFQEGLHIIRPWDKLYIYNVRIQERNLLIDVITKDGLTIQVEISIRFHPNINTLGLLHKYLGPNYVETVILPEIAATTRDIIGLYDIDSLYSDKRVEIQRRISNIALSEINNKNSLNNNEPHDNAHYKGEKPPSGDFENDRVQQYILFEDLFIKNIVLPVAVKGAIEKKIVSEQEFLRYRYLIAAELQERDRKVIEAQGIKLFEDSSRISILKWRGLQATEKLATSPNSKTILIGTDENLPIILNGETNSK